MPFLHDKFCYSTLEEAAQAQSSLAPQSVADGIVLILPYTARDASSVNLNFRYANFTTSTTSVFSVQQDYQTCTNVGPVSNLSGISLADAIETSWAVVVVWAFVWAIKNIRRSL